MGKGREYFQAAFDALPDHAAPPTDGPFYPGDICKVNGKAMVWFAGQWKDPEPLNKETFVVQLHD